jgi:hypothetical protein
VPTLGPDLGPTALEVVPRWGGGDAGNRDARRENGRGRRQSGADPRREPEPQTDGKGGPHPRLVPALVPAKRGRRAREHARRPGRCREQRPGPPLDAGPRDRRRGTALRAAPRRRDQRGHRPEWSGHHLGLRRWGGGEPPTRSSAGSSGYSRATRARSPGIKKDSEQHASSEDGVRIRVISMTGPTRRRRRNTTTSQCGWPIAAIYRRWIDTSGCYRSPRCGTDAAHIRTPCRCEVCGADQRSPGRSGDKPTRRSGSTSDKSIAFAGDPNFPDPGSRTSSVGHMTRAAATSAPGSSERTRLTDRSAAASLHGQSRPSRRQ